MTHPNGVHLCRNRSGRGQGIRADYDSVAPTVPCNRSTPRAPRLDTRESWWPGNPGGAWCCTWCVGQDGGAGGVGGCTACSLPLDVDEAVEYPRTTSRAMGTSEGKEGSPLSPPKPKLVGLGMAVVPAAGTAWIIVFLGGGWWSALLSKGWWLWSVARVELGVYKARRPGPSQSITGLPAHHTHTKHEGLCEYPPRGWWLFRGV